MTTRDYKEKFGLAYSTALISEAFRAQLKQRSLDYFRSLTPEQLAEFRSHAREAGRAGREKWNKIRQGFQPAIQLETKNKRGTCPDQLLDKIKEVATKLGRTPSKGEFIDQTGGQRYTHLIRATFGSWGKALDMLDMKPQPPIAKSHPNQNKAGIHSSHVAYDDDELLEYLTIFVENHHRIPTHTDCKRGLIPSAYVWKRFGGLPKARELAGIQFDEVLSGRQGVTPAWVAHM